MKQTLKVYRNSNIILLSNFKDCNTTKETYQKLLNISYINLVDTQEIISNKSNEFYRYSLNMYQNHTDLSYKPGLWITSTLRFFLLEDLMNKYQFNELLHIESDNMIYGPWNDIIIPDLRKNYPNLASTRLNDRFLTASIALKEFNDILFSLGSRSSETWKSYIQYLKGFSGA